MIYFSVELSSSIKAVFSKLAGEHIKVISLLLYALWSGLEKNNKTH